MKDPSHMSERDLDLAIARLGTSAANLSHDPRLAYRAEVFAMVRRVNREGNHEQIYQIRRWMREHPGQDLRPFINHVMNWEGAL